MSILQVQDLSDKLALSSGHGGSVPDGAAVEGASAHEVWSIKGKGLDEWPSEVVSHAASSRAVIAAQNKLKAVPREIGTVRPTCPRMRTRAWRCLFGASSMRRELWRRTEILVSDAVAASDRSEFVGEPAGGTAYGIRRAHRSHRPRCLRQQTHPGQTQSFAHGLLACCCYFVRTRVHGSQLQLGIGAKNC